MSDAAIITRVENPPGQSSLAKYRGRNAMIAAICVGGTSALAHEVRACAEKGSERIRESEKERK